MFGSEGAASAMPFEHWACKEGVLNDGMIKNFSAWGLNMASTMPEDEGASGVYYLFASPVGRTRLRECPELINLIKPEALNRVVTAEGPDQGKNAVYWLCNTEDGRELLRCYPELRAMITQEGLNSVVAEGPDKGKTAVYGLCDTESGQALLGYCPELRAMITQKGFNSSVAAEGPDQGKTPLYCLSKTTRGHALLLGYQELVAAANEDGMNASVTAPGPDYGKTAAYNFCAMPTGHVLLRSPAHRRLSRLIRASTLNQAVEGDERDGPMSPAAHLMDAATGLQILQKDARLAGLLDPSGLSEVQRDDFFDYQRLNEEITVQQYAGFQTGILEHIVSIRGVPGPMPMIAVARTPEQGMNEKHADYAFLEDLFRDKEEVDVLHILKYYLEVGLLKPIIRLSRRSYEGLLSLAASYNLYGVVDFILENNLFYKGQFESAMINSATRESPEMLLKLLEIEIGRETMDRKIDRAGMDFARVRALEYAFDWRRFENIERLALRGVNVDSKLGFASLTLLLRAADSLPQTAAERHNKMQVVLMLLVAGARSELNGSLRATLPHYAPRTVYGTMIFCVVGAKVEAEPRSVHPSFKPYYDLMIAMDDLGIDRSKICEQSVAGELSPDWIGETGLREKLSEKTGQTLESVDAFIDTYQYVLAEFTMRRREFLKKKAELAAARSTGITSDAGAAASAPTTGVRSGAATVSGVSGAGGGAGNNALLWHRLLANRFSGFHDNAASSTAGTNRP